MCSSNSIWSFPSFFLDLHFIISPTTEAIDARPPSEPNTMLTVNSAGSFDSVMVKPGGSAVGKKLEAEGNVSGSLVRGCVLIVPVRDDVGANITVDVKAAVGLDVRINGTSVGCSEGTSVGLTQERKEAPLWYNGSGQPQSRNVGFSM